MENCYHCDKTMLFGGHKKEGLFFCSKACESIGLDLIRSDKLPMEIVEAELQRARHSHCPQCKGLGPIDVHFRYTIWSIVYFTKWAKKSHVCCRACGVRSQLSAAAFSVIFGWWGLPWGLVMTPVQIGKNLGAIFFPRSRLNPTKEFEKLIRLSMIENLRQEIESLQKQSP